ncbi:MAG: hypothetical protein ACRDDY_06235 [Clostridium sp.]|uniref:hypothetical protein n=1 Tax=Clostridium sp. TaxID=1506 RepID=UPI003EE42867
MITHESQLKSQCAIDKNAIINKGLTYYTPDVQIADIEFFRKRKRMTNEEADFLLDKIEKQIQDRDNAILGK